ncbi:protein FAR1-RELATED SEQUENCE 5-like [Magnolia sinica]|uniref:protein FAR1-RELATED SEQUENCE 5-like n=1 Tax=Magnolia sinica TaxID=86752 RepID=UPI002658FB30|nr:protein FAR1-RELATED SEQUENCE 5-like [Magnolia sinica]XP_058109542.1 protein FAR1-RELATED SEQUENCE 5-like [Magnolia sinica]XP_058109543.1 protein FAR1-RELATED SEQUENCE 5-like [Magnolia sinica]XP_058109544.1 protein FAR1-RELATED SEQUENCE 5-like [Magnolia sinica]
MAEAERAMEFKMHVESNRTNTAVDIGQRMGENEIGESMALKEFNACTVDANLEPYMGMEFESEEAAFSFYNEYARCVGFGVRKRSTRYSKRDNRLIATQYVCFKEGFKQQRETVKNPRPIIREGCPATIKVKKADSKKWVVHFVEKDHNHALLSPTDVHNLRSHRKKLDFETCVVSDKLDESSALITFEGDANVEPSVGMEFESLGTVYSFYNAYARHMGFGIRKTSTRYSKRDRSLIAIRFVCSIEGFKQSNGKVENTRIITTECKAMISVKKTNSGKWFIHAVEKDHNHELCPNKVHCFRSHRKLQKNAKCSNNTSHASGLRLKKLTPVSGKQSNTKITNSEFANDAGKNRIEQMWPLTFPRGDIKALIDYFKHMQAENASFFYAIEIDEEEHIRNIFWADSKSRMASNYFSDVVTFDTMYLEKKYHVPFAPFVGVNHHGQSVLLGCALLADKTISSFIWIFQTWVASMNGRYPISVITEHDRTIQAAVAEVFPETHHRLCMFHIQRNITKRWGHVCKEHWNFKAEFDKCVYQTETVDEFETRWGLLLDTFNLREDEWLKILYEDRQQWVPVYLKGKFFAGLSTSQGSEGINSFFDGYVNAESTLKEFLEQYDTALQSRYDKESLADFEMMQTKPNLRTTTPFEKQAANVYTAEIFKVFQVEICEAIGYYERKIKENDTVITYMVAKFGEEKTYTVTLNAPEMRVACSCCMFEFVGILCRHALRVLSARGVLLIPPHYILKRWTKDAKSRLGLNEHAVRAQRDYSQSMILRYNDLCQLSVKLAEEGALSIESYNVALHAFQEALEKIVSANNSYGACTS